MTDAERIKELEELVVCLGMGVTMACINYGDRMGKKGRNDMYERMKKYNAWEESKK